MSIEKVKGDFVTDRDNDKTMKQIKRLRLTVHIIVFRKIFQEVYRVLLFIHLESVVLRKIPQAWC